MIVLHQISLYLDRRRGHYFHCSLRVKNKKAQIALRFLPHPVGIHLQVYYQLFTNKIFLLIVRFLGYRKLHGDLIYLYAVTLEEKRLHITACTRGFYINQSTDEEFNPKPANPNHLSHSLIELLSQVSPSFKRNFTLLQRKRTQRHPFERVATPYQVKKIVVKPTLVITGKLKLESIRFTRG